MPIAGKLLATAGWPMKLLMRAMIPPDFPVEAAAMATCVALVAVSSLIYLRPACS